MEGVPADIGIFSHLTGDVLELTLQATGFSLFCVRNWLLCEWVGNEGLEKGLYKNQWMNGLEYVAMYYS